MLKPVGGIYGKPMSRLVGKPLPLDRSVLDQIGEILVESVVLEARKDFAKQRKMPHGPVGIPDTEDFFKSFSYKVVGKSTVEVTCSWPYIKPITEGREPYRMAWLTQQNGVNVVPIIKKDGEVIFRMAPMNLGNAWIHPGFARHTFIQRGIRKGREKAIQILSREALKTILASDILR
jgi:hypothetical protein